MRKSTNQIIQIKRELEMTIEWIGLQTIQATMKRIYSRAMIWVLVYSKTMISQIQMRTNLMMTMMMTSRAATSEIAT